VVTLQDGIVHDEHLFGHVREIRMTWTLEERFPDGHWARRLRTSKPWHCAEVDCDEWILPGGVYFMVPTDYNGHFYPKICPLHIVLADEPRFD
jgi:hypothetical protein